MVSSAVTQQPQELLTVEVTMALHPFHLSLVAGIQLVLWNRGGFPNRVPLVALGPDQREKNQVDEVSIVSI